MTIYESNLELFKEKASNIYNTLLNDTPMFNVEIESDEDQKNDIIIHDNCRCFINSIYDTEAEMANMVKDANIDTEIFVVFGLANGKIITYLQKHFPNISRIFIIEPSLDICKMFLSRFNFMDFVKKEIFVSLLINKSKDEMSSELANVILLNKNVALIEHISYRTVFKSYYNHIQHSMIELLRTHRYNIRTLNSSYLIWVRNCIINSQYKSLMTDNLFKHIEGKPAVIVSAGPSLKKNMHLLNQLKGKAIMFAGGSTVRVLAKNGIIPDIRASIDAYYQQNIIFQNTDNNDGVPLLYRNMSNVDLVKNYAGPKFKSIIDDDFLWKYICDKKDISKTIFATSPSVSNFIFEVLIAAKCNPIIFVGQDMCSYGDAKYADSTETNNAVKMKKEMEMLDIYGNNVTTELNYLQIKYSFDRQAKRCQTRLINATEGGLGIEGTEIKTLESVLNEDLTKDIDFDINKIIEIEESQSTYEENYLKVSEALQEIKEESKEILDILKKVFGAIDKYAGLKVNNYKEGRLRREVEYIDKLYEQLMEKGLYKNVATQATASIIQAIEAKYAYDGSDKVKVIDNKIAKIASTAEIIYKYIQEFQKH